VTGEVAVPLRSGCDSAPTPDKSAHPPPMPRPLLLAIQSVLLVIGVAALSGTAGGFLVFLMMSCLFPTPKGENWGGAGVWLLALSCGGILAAIAGTSAAVTWIGQHGGRRWHPATWAGIAVGLVVALALSARSFNYDWDDAWLAATAFRIVTCSAAGGLFSALLCRAFPAKKSRAAEAKKHNAKRPPRTS
jgi:hypothetical protein